MKLIPNKDTWKLIGLGTVTVLGLPPIYLVPIWFISFPLFLNELAKANSFIHAFKKGWAFGLGFFGFGLYWVSHSLLIDPLRHGWLVPFVLLGMGGGMGLFIALGSGITFLLGNKPLNRVLAWSATWCAIEWLRIWFLTGFPWNMLATGLVFSDELIQFAAYGGALSLSFLIVLSASLLHLRGVYPNYRVWILSFSVPVFLWIFGFVRLYDRADEYVPDMQLRLIQANVDQANKWLAEMREKHLNKHIELSGKESDIPPTHVIWPETAASFLLEHEPGRRLRMASTLLPEGFLMTGAPRATPPGVKPFLVWNSLQVINYDSEIIATYDKFHLVPFGEYMPLRKFLPFEKLTHGSQDFSVGQGPVTVAIPNTPPFSPLICYEVIFPGEIVDSTNRPHWLLNITNDGWFGQTSGPYQHLATSRLRSVEEGLPLVRAANTGISAVVDSFGRIKASLPLGQEGVLDSRLPKHLIDPTIFSRLKHLPMLAIVAIMIIYILNKGNKEVPI